MDNLQWHGGIMFKRRFEQSGRPPTLSHLAVALWLTAQEEGKTLEEIVQVLIEASTYDAAANKLDKDARIRQLMGY